MKRTISLLFFLGISLFCILPDAAAQVNPINYCPAVDTNAIVVTLDNATPCNTSFTWRANGWQGYYNVYLSTTPQITATGTVGMIATNSTTVTLADFGANVAQYNTPYYVLVRLRNARGGQEIATLARYTINPTSVTGGSGSLNCARTNGGIITNVVLTRIMPSTPVSPSTTCPSGLNYTNLRSSGLDAINPAVLIPITWVGGGAADASHPAFMTWGVLKVHLSGRLSAISPQSISLKSDTPIGGGVVCQPCIATPAAFSTLNSETKAVPRIGYATAVNTLNPVSGLVNDNNCVEVSATLQW